MSSTRDDYIAKYGYDAVRKANGEDYEERQEALRDWFAGMALQGIIAGKSFTHDDLQRIGLTHKELRDAQISDAYATADAMLKARGDQSPPKR